MGWWQTGDAVTRRPAGLVRSAGGLLWGMAPKQRGLGVGSGAKRAGWGRRPQDTSPGPSLFRGEALSPLLLRQMVSQRPGPRREANTASSEFLVLKTIQLTMQEKGI